MKFKAKWDKKDGGWMIKCPLKEHWFWAQRSYVLPHDAVNIHYEWCSVHDEGFRQERYRK